MTRYTLPGSDHPAPAGVQCIGACDPAERFDIVVILRRQQAAAFHDLVDRLAARDPSAQPISRDEYERRFGASPEDVQRVERFAAAHGLKVVRADPAARRVVHARVLDEHAL